MAIRSFSSTLVSSNGLCNRGHIGCIPGMGWVFNSLIILSNRAPKFCASLFYLVRNIEISDARNSASPFSMTSLSHSESLISSIRALRIRFMASP